MAVDAADASVKSTVLRCIAGLRDQIEREACGRTQANSTVAQAVRHAENRRVNAEAQLRQARDARHRHRVAEDTARREALARLDHRAATIARMEASFTQGVAASKKEALEREKLLQRRQAVLDAKEGFTAADLGQGQLHGGGERFRRNRIDLLRKVIRLGDPLPPDKEANFQRWCRRMDDKGCKDFCRGWGSVIKNHMATVIQSAMGGDRLAFHRWHAEFTSAWCLDALELEVPGVGGVAASSGPTGA